MAAANPRTRQRRRPPRPHALWRSCPSQGLFVARPCPARLVSSGTGFGLATGSHSRGRTCHLRSHRMGSLATAHTNPRRAYNTRSRFTQCGNCCEVVLCGGLSSFWCPSYSTSARPGAAARSGRGMLSRESSTSACRQRPFRAGRERRRSPRREQTNADAVAYRARDTLRSRPKHRALSFSISRTSILGGMASSPRFSYTRAPKSKSVSYRSSASSLRTSWTRVMWVSS